MHGVQGGWRIRGHQRRRSDGLLRGPKQTVGETLLSPERGWGKWHSQWLQLNESGACSYDNAAMQQIFETRLQFSRIGGMKFDTHLAANILYEGVGLSTWTPATEVP